MSITVTVTARLHRSGKIYWMSQVCVGLQNLWWYYFCCVYPTLSCDLLSDEWVKIVGVGGVLLGCLHRASEVYGDLECLSGLERKLFFNPGSTTAVKMTPSILSPHVLYEGDAPEMHGFLTFRDSQPQICCVC